MAAARLWLPADPAVRLVLDTRPRTMPEPSNSRCLPGSARIGKITLAGAPIRRDTEMGWYPLPAMR
jgi:hypothetical protein